MEDTDGGRRQGVIWGIPDHGFTRRVSYRNGGYAMRAPLQLLASAFVAASGFISHREGRGSPMKQWPILAAVAALAATAAQAEEIYSRQPTWAGVRP